MLHERFRGHILNRSEITTLLPPLATTSDIVIDVGSGRGDFLFYLAEKYPQKTVYGIEIREKRFEKLARRLKQDGFENVGLILGDAFLSIPIVFEEGGVKEIYINFPDPWPKRRHARRRLITPAFVKVCGRVLKKGGRLSIATDLEWYAIHTKEVVSGAGIFALVEYGRGDDGKIYPTYFAKKWMEEGRDIYYQVYKKYS